LYGLVKVAEDGIPPQSFQDAVDLYYILPDESRDCATAGTVMILQKFSLIKFFHLAISSFGYILLGVIKTLIPLKLHLWRLVWLGVRVT
jgi:hypothetical protein